MRFGKHVLLGSAAMVGAALVACGGAPAVPEEPTWSEHVYPIIAGQCLHCHGASAARDGGGFRFDFVDPANPSACGAALVTSADLGPLLHIATIGTVIALQEDTILTRPKMPPEPADGLEGWEIETIENWIASGRDKGDAPSGGGPRIRVTGTEEDGDDLVVSYIITDPDGDPVLGEITAPGADAVPVRGSGGGTITIPDADDEFTITAELCDGWDVVTREVDVSR